VLPGSKQVSGDLAWLRAQGLDRAIERHAAAGRPVLGICGGLQMLGQSLADPEGHDGEVFDERPGLGLLPLATSFAAGKRLCIEPVRFGTARGVWSALSNVVATGYQIRCGSTDAGAEQGVLFDADGQPIGWQHGSVLGLYAHGLFEAPAVMQALFGATVPTLDSAIDGIADIAERHLDAATLARVLGQSRPA
jgi:adenosylcobyric acid synthase